MTDEPRQPDDIELDDLPEPDEDAKKKRASDAEIEQRVTKVVEWMSSGLSRAQILRQAKDKTDWKVQTRTIDGYIARATVHFKALAAIDREAEYGKAKSRMEMILAMSLKMQDLQRAIAAAKEIHTLTGVYPVVESKLKIEGFDLFNLLSEKARAAGLDLAALLNALIDEMGNDQS